MMMFTAVVIPLWECDFMEFYFEKFSAKYSEEKMINILQKTWKKMSSKGRKAALDLRLSDHSKDLISKALD